MRYYLEANEKYPEYDFVEIHPYESGYEISTQLTDDEMALWKEYQAISERFDKMCEVKRDERATRQEALNKLVQQDVAKMADEQNSPAKKAYQIYQCVHANNDIFYVTATSPQEAAQLSWQQAYRVKRRVYLQQTARGWMASSRGKDKLTTYVSLVDTTTTNPIIHQYKRAIRVPGPSGEETTEAQIALNVAWGFGDGACNVLDPSSGKLVGKFGADNHIEFTSAHHNLHRSEQVFIVVYVHKDGTKTHEIEEPNSAPPGPSSFLGGQVRDESKGANPKTE